MKTKALSMCILSIFYRDIVNGIIWPSPITYHPLTPQNNHRVFIHSAFILLPFILVLSIVEDVCKKCVCECNIKLSV